MVLSTTSFCCTENRTDVEASVFTCSRYSKEKTDVNNCRNTEGGVQTLMRVSKHHGDISGSYLSGRGEHMKVNV